MFSELTSPVHIPGSELVERNLNHDWYLISGHTTKTQRSFELTDLLEMLAFASMAHHSDRDGHTSIGLWRVTDGGCLDGISRVLKMSKLPVAIRAEASSVIRTILSREPYTALPGSGSSFFLSTTSSMQSPVAIFRQFTLLNKQRHVPQHRTGYHTCPLSWLTAVGHRIEDDGTFSDDGTISIMYISTIAF